jgi:hypothetical protein
MGGSRHINLGRYGGKSKIVRNWYEAKDLLMSHRYKICPIDIILSGRQTVKSEEKKFDK